MISEQTLKEMLITNDSLFNHIYIVHQEFTIVPQKQHYGVAINYIDLQECKREFINELINSIVDWVYSATKQNSIEIELKKENRTRANIASEMRRKAFSKFRKSNDELLLQGQFGELLLFVFLQRFFNAVPLLRKMPLTTSNKHERFGADAIHFVKVKDKNIFYLGEAKSYTSKYKFNTAFEDAITSILSTFEKHREEMDLYLYEEFLESELEEVAQGYLNGTILNPEIHLVSAITYNEIKKIPKLSEDGIKKAIKSVIEDRFRNFDNNKIDIENNPIIDRLTYIVFPVWDLEAILKEFQKLLG